MSDRANWLVALQVLLLGTLVVVPFAVPVDPLWAGQQTTVLAVLLMITGVVLAVAGAAALGRDLVVWVAPREGATLRTTGVFRLTRNPIYVGLIVFAAGWTTWFARVDLIVLWVLVVVVLVVKARVEQRRLLEAFGDEYREYADRTPLLLWGRGIR